MAADKTPHPARARDAGAVRDRRQAEGRGTLRALGLGSIGQTNILPDRPEIRGMIHRVPHLIEVEVIETETETE